MKTNELMMGDWVVLVDPDTKERTITRVLFGDLSCGVVLGLIEPIPIAPEILEKNGFDRFDFRNIKGHHEWSYWIDTLTSISLWCRELNDNPKDGWMVKIESPFSSLCTRIESIHELQHALRLCKIEKEIEL